MALLNMQRIYIYALKKDRKKILELLQLKGVVEVDDMHKKDKVFYKTDVTEAKAGFEKNIAAAKEALEILNAYVPYKKSLLSPLYGRKEVSPEIYEGFKDKYESVVSTATKIISLNKEIAENKAEILKLQTQIEMLAPWISLDIPLNFNGTKHTAGFIGTLPNEWTLEEIYGKLKDFMPLNVDVISASKEQTCIFVLCTKDKADEVYNILRENEFILPSITFDRSPAEQLDYLKKQVSEAEAAIDNAEKEITLCADDRDDLLFLQDYGAMRADEYNVISKMVQSNKVFIIKGFVPEKDGQAIAKELKSEFSSEVELKEPSKKDSVPVLYRNNAFSEPLEGTVSAFSPPGPGEMDPTMVMSLFYYVLFGIMLADVGYGAIMAFFCAYALIRFKKTIETPMKKTMRMYLFCGISTAFWGAVFGSYFGDLADVISVTFLGGKTVPVIPPLWFFPAEKPMLMLTFSMAFGIVHLFTGLGMKCYQMIKQRDFKSALYDVIFWYMLLISCIIILLSMDMITNILGIQVSIPSTVVSIAKIIAAIAAIGIIATNGRSSKNPFKRFLKGLYALYGISGYLSDVLSYSRLLALGLATGVICNVINKMAAMAGAAGGKVLGPVIFIIIILGGHSLNLAINALGAYVHTNRLQYVEFFGKFYGGGGRLFQPFHVNTKYYKFKEKIKDEYAE